MSDRTPSTVLTLAVALALLPAAARAAAWLDSSFSVDGKVGISFDYAGEELDRGRAIAAFPDGSVVVAGSVEAGGAGQFEFGVARIDASGNVTWWTHIDFGGTDDQATAVVVQPDQRIVVAGWTNKWGDYDVAVARLSALGALDTDFSGDGRMTFAYDYPTPGNDLAFALALEPPSGGVGAPKILVGGDFEYDDGGGFSETEMGVFRLHPNGTVDTAFGGVGTGLARFAVLDNDGGESTHLSALATLEDGRPFLCGRTRVGGLSAGVAMLLATDGADTVSGWGSDGVALVQLHLGFQPAACLWDERTQSLTLAGRGFTSGGLGFDMMFARLGSTGALQTGWGAGGSRTIAYDWGGGHDDELAGLARQSDGKLVAVGSVQAGATDFDYAFVRLLPSGALDPSFGTGGVRLVAFDLGQDHSDRGAGIALTSWGRIVGVGTIDRSVAGDRDFGAAALLTEDLFADGFELHGVSAWSSSTVP